MTQEYDDFVVLDMKDAIPVVATIKSMRDEITNSCTIISQNARKLSLTNKKVALRLKKLEIEVNQIRENVMTTYNLDNLRKLKCRCDEISQRLEGY